MVARNYKERALNSNGNPDDSMSGEATNEVLVGRLTRDALEELVTTSLQTKQPVTRAGIKSMLPGFRHSGKLAKVEVVAGELRGQAQSQFQMLGIELHLKIFAGSPARN